MGKNTDEDMEMNDPIVILSAKRTPIGGLGGALAGKTATELGGIAASAAVAEAKIDASHIDKVYFGNVLSAGQGQAPARQVALAAGASYESVSTTVNKMCGSGMEAAIIGHDALQTGSANLVLVGGMESMTNAPYLLPKVRSGLRMGHSEIKDHMFLDGLEDAYERGTLMGVFADRCAAQNQITREEQDEYAIGSLDRAIAATNEGRFASEIAPVTMKSKKSTIVVEEDEQPQNAKREKITSLRPAFSAEGTVTAANASSISDGAAALILTRQSFSDAHELVPRARILGYASHGTKPEDFPLAPIGAMQNLVEKTGIPLSSFDLFEINEAFAVVPLVAMKQLGLPLDKVNVMGGACALGHPIGASGARILITLLNAMEQRGVNRGMASVCIGGGEATAIAIELIN